MLMLSRSRNVLDKVWSLRDPFKVTTQFAKRLITDRPKIDAQALLRLMSPWKPLVTKEEHLFWAEKIKPHFPHCNAMYNNLVQHGGGHVSHDTFYILHDCTSSHVVLCDKKIAPSTLHIGVFCLEEDVDQLIEVLGSAPIITWQDVDMVIHHIPPYLVGPLQRLVEENEVKMDLSECIAFSADADLHAESLRIDKGFRMCRLGRAGVRRLFETAEYGEGMPLELMYSLAQRVPYLGVYRDAAVTQDTIVDPVNLPLAGDEEIPIAWACSTPSGEAGKLMTEKAFRRSGFGGLLSMTLARRQFALLGFMPYAFCDIDNIPSISMIKKIPGCSYTHDAFWLSSLKPQK